MTRRRAACAAAFVATAAALASARQGGAPDLRALSDAHRVFALRDAISQGTPPLFYRGVVEAAFNDAADAERDLKVVVQSDPGGADAFDARTHLMTLAFRNGRYLDAERQFERLLAQKPGAPNLLSEAALLHALARTPDQEVVDRHEFSGRMDVAGGNLLLPVKVNGQFAEFAFDLGSNLSVVSESEAARLGLDARPIDASPDGIDGPDTRARLATGVPLVVGNLRLSNVALLVLPDSQAPFDALPPGKRGVLGIPVLLAMRTLRWRTTDQTFDCGFESGGLDLSHATVAFDGTAPLRLSGFESTLMDTTAVMTATQRRDSFAMKALNRAHDATVDFGRMTMTLK